MTDLPTPEDIAVRVEQEQPVDSAVGFATRAVEMDRAVIVRWMREESDAYNKIAQGQSPGREKATASAFSGTLMLIANDLEASMAGLRRSIREAHR
jgi:hypothetical protein